MWLHSQELAENLEIVTAERQVQSDKLKQLKEDRDDGRLRFWELFLGLLSDEDMPSTAGIPFCVSAGC